MDDLTLPLIAAIIFAYFLGSLSFAVIVSKLFKLDDPRTYGSGNPGATNVLRSGNKKAALLTLILDAVKGAIAVLIAKGFGFSADVCAWVGVAAFIGHLWPVFFRFKGGKGVATAAGVLLTFDPVLGGCVLATWLAVAFISKYSSLAALCAALVAPFYQYFISGLSPALYAIALMGVLLIWRHASNIRKLMAGQESRIGHKKKASV